MGLFPLCRIKEQIFCFFNLDLDLAVNEKPFPKKIKLLIIDQMVEKGSTLEMALFLQRVYMDGVRYFKGSLKGFKKDFERFMAQLFLDMQKIVLDDGDISSQQFSFIGKILKTKYHLVSTGIKELILDLHAYHPCLLKQLDKLGIPFDLIERFLFLHKLSKSQTFDDTLIEKFHSFFPFHFASKMNEKQFSHLIKELKETVSFNWP